MERENKSVKHQTFRPVPPPSSIYQFWCEFSFLSKQRKETKLTLTDAPIVKEREREKGKRDGKSLSRLLVIHLTSYILLFVSFWSKNNNNKKKRRKEKKKVRKKEGDFFIFSTNKCKKNKIKISFYFGSKSFDLSHSLSLTIFRFLIISIGSNHKCCWIVGS